MQCHQLCECRNVLYSPVYSLIMCEPRDKDAEPPTVCWTVLYSLPCSLIICEPRDQDAVPPTVWMPKCFIFTVTFAKLYGNHEIRMQCHQRWERRKCFIFYSLNKLHKVKIVRESSVCPLVRNFYLKNYWTNFNPYPANVDNMTSSYQC